MIHIENHFDIFDVNEFVKCLNLLPNIYHEDDISISIHNNNTVSNCEAYFTSTFSGDIGFYSLEQKKIDVTSCNFYDVVYCEIDIMKLITLCAMIHELRHSLQHKLMPVTFSNYLSGKTSYIRVGHGYKDQFVEIDARRFTERFFNRFKGDINRIFNIDKDWSYKNNVIHINGFELRL